MNDRDSAYQENDAFRRMAALTDHYGIDQDEASRVCADVVGYLRQVLDKAKDAKVETRKAVVCPECQHGFHVELLDVEKISKTTSNLAKTADTVVRLTAFTQGKEDSRPGMGGGNQFLEALTNDQLKQVMAWVTENQAVGQ
jgi:hypothetical protein